MRSCTVEPAAPLSKSCRTGTIIMRYNTGRPSGLVVTLEWHLKLVLSPNPNVVTGVPNQKESTAESAYQVLYIA